MRGLEIRVNRLVGLSGRGVDDDVGVPVDHASRAELSAAVGAQAQDEEDGGAFLLVDRARAHVEGGRRGGGGGGLALRSGGLLRAKRLVQE